MMRRSIRPILLVLSFGLIICGFPKDNVAKEELPIQTSEGSAAGKQELRLEAGQKYREAKERNTVELKTEEAKQDITVKDYGNSVVAEKSAGNEGEVFEGSLFRDIHFDVGKYDIRPEDAEILKANAALLMKYPNVKIQIEGHCDERGTVEYNLALAERRANSAKKYLISLGISQDRLFTISYVRNDIPLDPGHNEKAWAKNRRVHFVILSK